MAEGQALSKESSTRQSPCRPEFLPLPGNDFLSTVSHELRTPMTAIMGSLELLRNQEDVADRNQLLQILDGAAHRLLETIENLLDIFHIQAGRMELEMRPFDLRTVVAEALRGAAEQASGKNLRFVWTVDSLAPATVTGDAARLTKVIASLAENAVKFTRRGEIQVNVTARGDALTFSVRDTGIGIAHDALKRIFEPFTQEDGSLTRRYGGTGLGLTISRELVTMMGGAISARSIMGKGSTFVFTVPLRPAASSWGFLPFSAAKKEAARRPEDGRIQAPEKQMVVLLAEDDEAHAEIVRRNLEETRIEHRLEHVADGQQALDYLFRRQAFSDPQRSLRPGVILLDLRLPRVDGLEVLKTIKKDPELQMIPVVILTTSGAEGDMRQAYSQHVNSYLVKPVDLEGFAALIQTIAFHWLLWNSFPFPYGRPDLVRQQHSGGFPLRV